VGWQPSKLELEAQLGASRERQAELEWRLQQMEGLVRQHSALLQPGQPAGAAQPLGALLDALEDGGTVVPSRRRQVGPCGQAWGRGLALHSISFPCTSIHFIMASSTAPANSMLLICDAVLCCRTPLLQRIGKTELEDLVGRFEAKRRQWGSARKPRAAQQPAVAPRCGGRPSI
jgi:hypothetical protein